MRSKVSANNRKERRAATPHQVPTLAALRKALAPGDGTDAAAITLLFEQFAGSDAVLPPRLLSKVVRLVTEAPTQRAATWLLKHHVAKGGVLPAQSVEPLVRAAEDDADWQSRLHALQCLPGVQIPASMQQSVEALLRQGLRSENKFVRAWAYGGFGELARQFPGYQAEAEALFAKGLRDEPASVRARIRQIAIR